MFHEPSRSTNKSMHFQIGVVPVSIRTEIPSVREAFGRTYDPYACDDPAPIEFQFELFRRRGLGPFRRPYVIRSGEETLFTLRYEAELLPHLEWAINLQIMRQFHGYFQIHAGVLERDGKGVILPGTPGSGKSTLCAALLRRGWGYLSDEFALFDPGSRRLHPYPKAVCIKRGGFSLIEQLGLPLRRELNYRKGQKGCVGYIDPLDVRADAVGRPCKLAAVIFPKYNGKQVPMLTAISRAEAAFELNRVAFNFMRFERQGIALLADVIRTAACYRLGSGAIGATCDLLEGIVDALPVAEPSDRRDLPETSGESELEFADEHALV